jgi:hypothetical protein
MYIVQEATELLIQCCRLRRGLELTDGYSAWEGAEFTRRCLGFKAAEERAEERRGNWRPGISSTEAAAYDLGCFNRKKEL